MEIILDKTTEKVRFIDTCGNLEFKKEMSFDELETKTIELKLEQLKASQQAVSDTFKRLLETTRKILERIE